MATANFTTKPPMHYMKLGAVSGILKSLLQRHMGHERVAWYVRRRVSDKGVVLQTVPARLDLGGLVKKK
jgi:hypothetical protein